MEVFVRNEEFCEKKDDVASCRSSVSFAFKWKESHGGLTEKVIKDWTDYNGHLNVAFYVRIFDIAADVMLDNFKMGGESAKKDKSLYEQLKIYN